MRLIVGLGNPERRYDSTRHNAGFMVVDALVGRFAADQPVRSRFHGDCYDTTLDGHRAVLIKPMTYMNRSGLTVGEALRFYKLDPADLLVVADDLYLDLGVVRLRAGGGTGGHNGLGDIARVLGTEAFPRCRVGIGPKPAGSDQARWVLGRLSEDESDRLAPAVERAAQACVAFAASGIDDAMNRFNVRAKPPAARKPRPSSGSDQAPPASAPPSTPADRPERAVHPGWLDPKAERPTHDQTD